MNAAAAPLPGFTLALFDSQHPQRFEHLASFVGADASGSFGILPHHARMVAVLRYGLARFAGADGAWHYLALPGGVLHFADNTLALSTVRYFLGDRRELIVGQLAAEMAREDSELQAVRATLAGIERTLLRRLGELSVSMQRGMAR
jgi:F-type H+-transporting ATPase subunit epsilon